MRPDAPLVTASAAVVLAEAAVLATARGSAVVTMPDLMDAIARSVADGRRSRLRAVLATLDVELPAPAGTERDTPLTRDLAPLSDQVREVIDTAGDLAVATGEAVAATPHLLAAAVELGHVETLARHGVTSDLLLARAVHTARDGAEVDPDDLVRASGPEPIIPALPDLPSPQELSRRTTGRRSAVVARLMSGMLPSGRRTSTPLGRRRIRTWTVAHLTEYFGAYAAILALVLHAVGSGAYWQLSLVLLMSSLSSTVSVSVLVLTRLPVVILAPPLVGALVVVNLAGALAVTWTMAWMLRVDRGDPGLSRSAVWRGYWRKANGMLSERMGNAVRAES